MLSPQALEYIRYYESRRDALESALGQGQRLLEAACGDCGISGFTVVARLKKKKSLVEKLAIKNYADPRKELTDMLGFRVITNFQDEVDTVAARLSDELKIHRSKSVDKRKRKPEEFGYRSVHLICSLGPSRIKAVEYQDLAPLRFEVQVRCLLEHGWAEMEHEIRYKCGIDLPAVTNARFHALAATLELVDSEFVRLRSERDVIVADRRTKVASSGSETLDVAWVVAVLDSLNPSGLASGGLIERRHLESLRLSGLTTVSDLQTALADPAYIAALGDFAAGEGLAVLDVSHLARIIELVRHRSLEVHTIFFGEG